MEYVRCDFCGMDDYTVWAKNYGINVVKCNNCGLMYSNPRLTSDELTEFYKEEYFKTGGNYTEDALRMKQYDVDIKDFEKVCRPPGKILDVGCAIGLFLNRLPGSWEKYGIDISKEAIELGKREYGLNLVQGDLPSSSSFQADSFDVVLMRGTLEHVQSPKAYIEKIHEVLNPGGIFVISNLPNLGSFAARLYRKDFRLLLPRQHLYHFTMKTIEKYLFLFDLNILRIYYPYLETPYANVVKDIFSLLFNRMLSKQCPPFFRNVMTIYAEKNKI